MSYLCIYFIISCILNMLFNKKRVENNDSIIAWAIDMIFMPVIFVAAVLFLVLKRIKEKKDAE